MGFSNDFPNLSRRYFPGLVDGSYRLTSDYSVDYNCIAWAAGDDTRWWWPDQMNLYYWPPGVPRNETIEAFIQAYALAGYVECDDAALEVGIEKVAIYGRPGEPLHAARQLASGEWTSKLGIDQDITHELRAVEGPGYGAASVFLKRPYGQRGQP